MESAKDGVADPAEASDGLGERKHGGGGCGLLWDEGLDFLDDEVNADFVVGAFGEDDVGEAFGRLDELEVHGADGGHVLLDHLLHGAAALFDVALQAADEPQIGVGVHEDLDVHQFAQRGIFENQNAVNDDGRARLDAHHFRQAAVRGEVVRGAVNGFPGAQLADVLDQQRRINGIGMVVIELGALVERKLGMVLVIRVVRENDGVFLGERFDNFAGDRGLARSRPAADADDQGRLGEVSNWLFLLRADGAGKAGLRPAPTRLLSALSFWRASPR